MTIISLCHMEAQHACVDWRAFLFTCVLAVAMANAYLTWKHK